MHKDIIIKLDKNEALVLLEWLRNTTDGNSINLEDKADKKVVWALKDSLEKQLPQKDDAGYDILVGKAREAVKNLEIYEDEVSL
ncbi:hypothetical protein AAIR98_000706 [Elusimicrobium simillimum]|uniref:hypothetical protein n=1 Tax=Elusimicrobium simillimum TaxID=3143438 RepID=UPI003C6F74BD